MTIRRDTRIFLKPTGTDTYNVIDDDGTVLIGSDEDYFIYFKNVSFANGMIRGRYLGEASENLIDGYCRQVDFDGDKFYVEGNHIRGAKLVAVDNKSRTIVIIQN